MEETKRIVIGITGASGAPLAIALLKALGDFPQMEAHLVISESARITIKQETTYTVDEVEALADIIYPINEIAPKYRVELLKPMG